VIPQCISHCIVFGFNFILLSLIVADTTNIIININIDINLIIWYYYSLLNLEYLFFVPCRRWMWSITSLGLELGDADTDIDSDNDTDFCSLWFHTCKAGYWKRNLNFIRLELIVFNTFDLIIHVTPLVNYW